MGYLLRMSDEIGDWLTDLRVSDPSAARLAGEALTALIGEGGSLGPPMVISLAGTARSPDLREALDLSYQHALERLRIVRRAVADAATLARDVQLQITGLESQLATLGEQHRGELDEGRTDLAEATAGELAAARAQVDELRRLLPGVIERDQMLSQRSLRLQAQADAFRTRKETLKARYTAAQAELAVHEAVATLGQDVGDLSMPAPDPDAPVAAAGKLREIIGEIERELLCPAPGLMELRPGAPGDSDIRILFAVEPPGTALLIAVLEGRDAVRDQHTEAVTLASDLLRRARAGNDPLAAALAFDDAASFLDTFFPAEADEVEVGAAALVARNRARTLAEQRARLGLTQAQVAERMSVRQERVSAIERAEPGATEVRTLAGYVEALGGRLEIIADFGGERVLLR